MTRWQRFVLALVRLRCFLLGHNMGAWFAVQGDYRFCDGIKCYRCGQLLWVYDQVTWDAKGPHGGGPIKVSGFVLAPESLDRYDRWDEKNRPSKI